MWETSHIVCTAKKFPNIVFWTPKNDAFWACVFGGLLAAFWLIFGYLLPTFGSFWRAFCSTIVAHRFRIDSGSIFGWFWMRFRDADMSFGANTPCIIVVCWKSVFPTFHRFCINFGRHLASILDAFGHQFPHIFGAVFCLLFGRRFLDFGAEREPKQLQNGTLLVSGGDRFGFREAPWSRRGR